MPKHAHRQGNTEDRNQTESSCPLILNRVPRDNRNNPPSSEEMNAFDSLFFDSSRSGDVVMETRTTRPSSLSASPKVHWKARNHHPSMARIFTSQVWNDPVRVFDKHW